MATPGTYLIFNEAWIAESSGGLEFLTDIEETRGKEYRNAVRTTPRTKLDLSKIQVNEEEWQEILAFQSAVKGMWKPFLVRDTRNYILNNELIGTGDGVETEFQIKITRSYQGVESFYVVNYPDEDYPALESATGQVWRDTAYLTVKVAGVTKTRTTDYTVDRETGIITFTVPPADGAAIRVTGTFYTLVRCNTDIISAQSMGAGWYEISEGVALISPVGGA